jgi:hypothetical protein
MCACIRPRLWLRHNGPAHPTCVVAPATNKQQNGKHFFFFFGRVAVFFTSLTRTGRCIFGLNMTAVFGLTTHAHNRHTRDYCNFFFFFFKSRNLCNQQNRKINFQTKTTLFVSAFGIKTKQKKNNWKEEEDRSKERHWRVRYKCPRSCHLWLYLIHLGAPAPPATLS